MSPVKGAYIKGLRERVTGVTGVTLTFIKCKVCLKQTPLAEYEKPALEDAPSLPKKPNNPKNRKRRTYHNELSASYLWNDPGGTR